MICNSKICCHEVEGKMNTEEVMDTVDLLEILWNQGHFYQFSFEMKELYEEKEESFVHAVGVIFQQRVERNMMLKIKKE